MKPFLWVALAFLLGANSAVVIAAEAPPPSARPLIWVTAADRAPILAKIESQPWARAAFDAMKERVRADVAAHRRDPGAYLRGLPLVVDAARPHAHPTLATILRNAAQPEGETRGKLQRFLLIGIDCGVLFFLTADETYARCAADILHATVEALVQMKPSESTGNGGWIYPEDHLYEARALGAQIPILYDFVATYLQAGARVHSLATQQPGSFDFAHAQQVFRTYARLAIGHGLINANWPVLEMPSLALNVLALDDPAERADRLAYVTTKDTPNQDSLRKVMRQFADAGGIWPESWQYSVGVSARVTYLAALLRRQSPPAISLDGYAAFPLSLVRLTDFRFPNGENIRFGDGPRRSGQPWTALELAYAHAGREGDTALQKTMGALINLGVAQGRYDRAKPHGHISGAESYEGPLQLLWFAPEIAGTMTPPLPRTTDTLAFAGVALQRNLSPTHDAAHALMAVVSGGAFVHSHASGMALELYGAGQVLGANAGKGHYTTDEHENYRRLSAAYNSVIVNGSSRSDGGWVNLGIDTVKPVSVEPAFGAKPVSPNHSFTVTRFTALAASNTKAEQERLVGLVRTSATAGYYVDVFRSRTAQPEQFHDYLYHNLGDTLALSAADQPVPLTATPERFQPAAGTSWSRNRSYLFPGWHVFKAARTSALFSGDLTAEFPIAKLKPAPASMRLFIPGAAGREYSSALAPATKEAPSPYDKSPTPVLVIRQRGEAWTQPFAVIYEASSGPDRTDRIQSVSAVRQNGVFSGLRVVSQISGRSVTQIILVLPAADSVFEDVPLGLSFRGRYAVITLDDRDACTSLYLGEGVRLGFKGIELVATSEKATAASARFDGTATLTAVSPASLLLPDGRRITSRPPDPSP